MDYNDQNNNIFYHQLVGYHYYTGVYILQMTRILFPGRADAAAKIFAIEGNPTLPY